MQRTLRERVRRVFEAARSKDPVRGLTHEFYRYPARFSPQFVGAAIDALTEPGETILDPFMGGGTSIVEAIVRGRRAVGCDLNSLSVFLARTKTLKPTQSQIEHFVAWASDAVQAEMDGSRPLREGRDPRFRSVPWWLYTRIQSLLERISRLADRVLNRMARCALLKTAQWALDCREKLPTSIEFLKHFESSVTEVSGGFHDLRLALSNCARGAGATRILHRSAIGIEHDGRIPQTWKPVKLVVTSPPYPGVHVLYHRWQVRGRRETATPYGICDITDGHGPSHYTLGGRHKHGVDRYFAMLKAAFSSVRAMLSTRSWIVQLVAFSEPAWQIEQYLQVMAEAGYKEASLASGGDRLWRSVPGRKWYAESRAGRELLLLHRPR